MQTSWSSVHSTENSTKARKMSKVNDASDMGNGTVYIPRLNLLQEPSPERKAALHAMLRM